MKSQKLYGYGAAVICAVIAATHAPGLTHHLHWKATLIWGISRHRSGGRVRIYSGPDAQPALARPVDRLKIKTLLPG